MQISVLRLLKITQLQTIDISFNNVKQENHSVIPYPCDRVEQDVTLKNSSTCLGKGAAPDNMIRTWPPNACFVYPNKHISDCKTENSRIGLR